MKEWNDLEINEHGLTLTHDSDVAEIIAVFELDKAETFGFKIRKSSCQETIIGYDSIRQFLYIDRKQSGSVDFAESFPSRHGANLLPGVNRIQLHLFIDRSSIEVFANDGLPRALGKPNLHSNLDL